LLSKWLLIVISTSVIALSGCQEKSMSSYEFDELRVYVSASKENRREAIQRCADGTKNAKLSTQEMKVISTALGVKSKDAGVTVCTRMVDGIISRNITYNDYILFMQQF
jgi:rRNA maturation endonuclease Nob1